MNPENEPVVSDPAIKPIVFVYKETPNIEMLKKTCPLCGSGSIHKVKSRVIKQPGNRRKLDYVVAHFKCNKCEKTFLHPKEVMKVINRCNVLPGDLQKIANRKKENTLLSPSEKPAE